MFAHHDAQPMDSALFNALKRGRDEEADVGAGGLLSFAEHRNKRLQTLPLRASPTPNRWSQNTTSPESLPLHMPHTITPSDSDSEEAAAAHFGHYSQQTYPQPQQPKSEFSNWSCSATGIALHEPAAPPLGPALDRDMDMMDSAEEPAPAASPGGLEPGQFHPDSVGTSITGRMPTPILPSFAAQVRGNNWGGAAGNVMQTGHSNSHLQQQLAAEGSGAVAGFGATPAHGLSTVMAVSPIPDRTVPRSLEHAAAMAEWSLVQNRPLPSPISESGGEELGSPGMVLDSTTMAPSLPPRAASAMEIPMYLRSGSPVTPSRRTAGPPLSTMDVESGVSPTSTSPLQHHHQNHQQDQESSPATPSPKKGHTRSRHTVNNWTHQPGMKKSFSIGYRADCEKCRLKVPGHFNHIIIS